MPEYEEAEIKRSNNPDPLDGTLQDKMTNLSHPHPVFSNYSLKRSEKLIITYR
jgi:hypothetical protein